MVTVFQELAKIYHILLNLPATEYITVFPQGLSKTCIFDSKFLLRDLVKAIASLFTLLPRV